MVRRLGHLAAVAFAAFTLSACDNDNDASDLGTPPSVTTATVEILHGSQNAPAVNVLLDQAPRITDLDYKEAAFERLSVGSVDVQVDGLLPGGATTTVVPETSIPVDEGVRTTIIASGDVTSLVPFVLFDTTPSIASDQTRVRVLHAASTAPAVSVYVNAPGEDIFGAGAAGLLGTIEYDPVDYATVGLLGPVEVPAGPYQVRVTVPSPVDAADILYDSGVIDLPGGADLLIAAVPTTRPGDAPISLLASTGSALLEFPDVDTPTNLRVAHASPNAPNVDVVVNDDFAASPRPIADRAFGTITDYVPVTLGDNYKVVPTTADTPVVIDVTPAFTLGTDNTLIASGLLPAAAPFDLTPIPLVDDNRPVATEAKVRLIHGSPAAGDVDIYVVPAGTTIDASVEPNFSDVPLGADTGYVSLADGTYDVLIDPVDDAIPDLSLPGLTFSAGGVYSAIAVDAVGGGTPLGVITFDDF